MGGLFFNSMMKNKDIIRIEFYCDFDFFYTLEDADLPKELEKYRDSDGIYTLTAEVETPKNVYECKLVFKSLANACARILNEVDCIERNIFDYFTRSDYVEKNMKNDTAKIVGHRPYTGSQVVQDTDTQI